MSKCKICGARIEDGTAVCPSCGAKVVSSDAIPDAGTNANVAAGTVRPRVSSTTQVIKTTCAHCGAEVIGEHRFCPQCGVNLKEAAEEKKKTASAQQTAPTAKASSPAPATNSTGNTSKLRISLIPESLTENTAYFDSVQDFCSSPEVQNMSGKPTLGVDGELTEGELDSIVDLVAQGRKVKAFNLSSCKNVRQLKDEQFFAEELFRRCTGLETVQLPYGRTFTQNSIKKEKPKKKKKGLLIDAIIAGLASLLFAVVLVYLSFLKSPLVVDNGIIIDVTNKDITTIEIPSSITAIGYGAFSNCSSLTSINIPTSVTSIGDYAFARCKSLRKVESLGSIAIIHHDSFYGCDSLTSIYIPTSVISIHDRAFQNCTSLTSITIPDSVTSIGDGAFSGCSSLKSITLSNHVTRIGESAFRSCTSLTSITIPSSVTSIGFKAFDDCNSLTVSCSKGSYAELHCKANKVKYISQ